MINGGLAVACSDKHYGHPRNLIAPGRAINMGGGWETARRVSLLLSIRQWSELACQRALADLSLAGGRSWDGSWSLLPGVRIWERQRRENLGGGACSPVKNIIIWNVDNVLCGKRGFAPNQWAGDSGKNNFNPQRNKVKICSVLDLNAGL